MRRCLVVWHRAVCCIPELLGREIRVGRLLGYIKVYFVMVSPFHGGATERFHSDPGLLAE